MSLGAVALLKTGGALAKYGISRYQNSKRKYGNTAIAKELARIKKEGAISPESQNQIMGEQNATLSSQSSTIRARTQNRLINQGMDGSIAGTRALQAPNTERMKQLGYTRRKLSAQNAQSKIDAGLQDAELRTAYNEETKANRRSLNAGVVGDLANVGAEYAMGKYKQGRQDDALALEKERYDATTTENQSRYETEQTQNKTARELEASRYRAKTTLEAERFKAEAERIASQPSVVNATNNYATHKEPKKLFAELLDSGMEYKMAYKYLQYLSSK
jgi:hypothetical protein